MQKLGQPAQEQGEVVAGSSEYGINAIAVGAFDIIAAHAVLGLEMADDRLDGGSATHLAPEGCSDPADLPGDPDTKAKRCSRNFQSTSCVSRTSGWPISMI